MKSQPRPLARRSRLQRAQGIEIEEKVWQLYVSGHRQVAIASRLNLSESRVSRYVTRRLQRIEEKAPHSAKELAVMRFIMNERLESIYAEAASMEDRYRGMMLQLKTLEQMAKLNGLNLESSNRAIVPQPPPYATPPEIAALVRERILKMHGYAAYNPAPLP
jgi:hypothetical protein